MSLQAAASLQRVARAGGDEMAARLLRLDAAPLHVVAPASTAGAPPDGPCRGAAVDYDVILLGGGLSLLYAPLLADAGLRVCVVEQHRVGAAQREWNASSHELQALQASGLLTPSQLSALILARYREGIFAWHGGGRQKVVGVLDCAVDAQKLLAQALLRAKRAGVQLDSQMRCEGLSFGDGGVAVHRVDAAGRRSTRSARLVLDGRGAQSPYARGDLVCPTVGGVLEDVDFDPQIGEILVTTQHLEDGRQLIWEAFPGRAGQLTVYLFYYAPRGKLPPNALQALYQQFFAKLPAYKRGAAHLVRPCFGYIPGWSRLSPGPRSPHPRLLLVGDAAARHSPLTFCGFGALLRSLLPVSQAVVSFLAADPNNLRRGPAANLVDDRPLHAATGALAKLIARPPLAAPAALNQLLDAAFSSLQQMGPKTFADLLQDRLPLADFLRFMRRTQRQCGGLPVYRMMAQSIGLRGMARWGGGIAAAALRGG